MANILAGLGEKFAPLPAPEPVEVRNGRAFERRLLEREAATDPLGALLKKEGLKK